MNPQAYAQGKKLFMEALERPADKQRQFLEDACDDPEIRGEVFALLRNHTQRTLLTKATVAETTTLSDLATEPKKPNLLRRAQTKAQTIVRRASA